MKIFLILTLVLFALFAYVRLHSIDPLPYHKDPNIIGRSGLAGGYYLHPIKGDDISPGFDASVEDVRKIIIANLTSMGADLALRSDDYETWVIKSKFWGFPDFFTFQIREIDGKAVPIIFSRLHYGYSDFGMNKKHVLESLKGMPQ